MVSIISATKICMLRFLVEVLDEWHRNSTLADYSANQDQAKASKVHHDQLLASIKDLKGKVESLKSQLDGQYQCLFSLEEEKVLKEEVSKQKTKMAAGATLVKNLEKELMATTKSNKHLCEQSQ